MEALRFPWDDEGRREVAPSAFRPRKAARRGPRDQAVRPPDRRDTNRARRPSPSVSAAVTAGLARPTVRPSGHATREGARDRVSGRIVQGPQRERHEPDYMLLAIALALAAMGILMVFSSSGVESAVKQGNVFAAVTTQLGWGLLGGLVLLVMMRVDYRYWRSFSVLGLALAVVLLLLVLSKGYLPMVTPLEINGATRWLQIGGLPAFQPTEVAKFALVIFAAHWLATRGTEVRSFRRGLLPFSIIVGFIAVLVVLEPDLGTTGVLVLSAYSMYFVAGGRVWQMLLLVPVGLAGVAGAVLLKPYMFERIEIFMDPFKYENDAGFQTVRGLQSLALGGVTGRGLGESQAPGGLWFPAAENDLIFAVIGQELGLIGGLAVIGLFLLLAWRGMRIAMHAPDTFGALLALGITAWLTFQAFINISVVVLLIPMTGMPLPFLSDGGTALVVALAAVGILLSISRETVTRGDSAHEDPHRGRGHGRPHLPRVGRRDPAAGPAA
jgi:cell division protein FtsW